MFMNYGGAAMDTDTSPVIAAATSLHQRGAWARCGHGCERGDGGE